MVAWVLWSWTVALILFMVAPMALVVLFSFGSNPMITFPLGGLTLHWYRDIFALPAFQQALRNSVTIAAVVGMVSTVVGTSAAMGLSRVPARWANAVNLALCFPIMLPGLVIGIALLSFYVSVGLQLSLRTVMLSHVVITQPYVILVIYARMANFDYTLVDSARDLGASPWTAFRTVTLPVIRTAVIGAALLAIAQSMDDFIITFFTIGGGNTLPTLVWGMLRTTLDPRVNAIATVLILGTMSATIIALRATRYRG